MTRQRALSIFFFLVVVSLGTRPSSAAGVRLSGDTDLSESRRWVAFADGGWVKVEKGRLGFYAPNGNEIRTLNLRGNEVLAAPHGCRVVGVIAYADQQPNTLHAVTFDLYDSSGKQMMRLNDPPFAMAIVAESGNAFVGIDGAEGLPRSVLRFYDQAGKQQKSIEVERFEGGAYCEDGSVFLFETAADGLQAFSAEGEMLGTIGPADHWSVSTDASIIARAKGSRLLFYREGELFQTIPWEAQLGNIRAVALSPNGSHVAAISATHASVFAVESGAALWTNESGTTPWNFRSAALTDGAGLVAFGSDYDPSPDAADRHQRSRCEVFDHSAKLIHSEEGQPTKWGALFPQVRFSQPATHLMFVDRDRLKLLAIE